MAAVERIVVQTTLKDKRAIVAKARRLALPISELMRRGAFAYDPESMGEEFARLADTANAAAERAGHAIDEAMDFIEASNRRIAAIEAKAAKDARALRIGSN